MKEGLNLQMIPHRSNTKKVRVGLTGAISKLDSKVKIQGEN